MPLDLTSAAAPLSGHQYTITLGDQEATITDVGAKVRRYAVGGRDVFTPFDEDEVAPAGHGAVLAPWPNRLRDGRYSVDGVEYQLPISEPSRGTALHGLAMWQRWSLLDPVSEPARGIADDDAHRSGQAVTLRLRLAPSAGYPFDLLLRATYRLTSAGLRVTVTATNLGQRSAPYGIGFHPWLSPGGASLDECTIRLDATTRVTVDDRLLPTGTTPATGSYDLTEPRTLRGLALDDAYVDVLRDDDGLSWIRLSAPDGRTAAVWMDGTMDTWQICTGDAIDPPAIRRTGVAAEPMSCVADAFRTGDRLVWLAPGEEHTVTWGATLL